MLYEYLNSRGDEISPDSDELVGYPASPIACTALIPRSRGWWRGVSPQHARLMFGRDPHPGSLE